MYIICIRKNREIVVNFKSIPLLDDEVVFECFENKELIVLIIIELNDKRKNYLQTALISI